MSHIYIDRYGLRIPKQTWDTYQADPAYRVVREFDNGVVQLRVIWNGRLNQLQAQSFRETWPVYEVRVMNYTAEGKLVPDPVSDNSTFPDEAAALDAYEEFLVTWADCEIDAEGKLVEVGNQLAPPPPPDPDAPTSTAIKNVPEDLGAAW